MAHPPSVGTGFASAAVTLNASVTLAVCAGVAPSLSTTTTANVPDCVGVPVISPFTSNKPVGRPVAVQV